MILVTGLRQLDETKLARFGLLRRIGDQPAPLTANSNHSARLSSA